MFFRNGKKFQIKIFRFTQTTEYVEPSSDIKLNHTQPQICWHSHIVISLKNVQIYMNFASDFSVAKTFLPFNGVAGFGITFIHFYVVVVVVSFAITICYSVDINIVDVLVFATIFYKIRMLSYFYCFWLHFEK